eukprot:3121744-Pleurochrysis_carterae.AAC.3
MKLVLQVPYRHNEVGFASTLQVLKPGFASTFQARVTEVRGRALVPCACSRASDGARPRA